MVNIGTTEAYEMVDRELMKKVLLSLKNNLKYADPIGKGLDLVDEKGNKVDPKGTSDVLASLPGSFVIHENGENDIRAIYCALVIADVLNLIEDNHELIDGIGDYIASC